MASIDSAIHLNALDEKDRLFIKNLSAVIENFIQKFKKIALIDKACYGIRLYLNVQFTVHLLRLCAKLLVQTRSSSCV